MKKLSIALALAALSGVAFANEIKVTEVVGTGTVASGSQATGLSVNMVLTEKSTVTAAKGGKITIKFPNGCTAVVTDAAPFVVSEQSCKALLALGSKQAPATSGPVISTPLMVAGGIGGAFVIHEATKSDNKPTAQQPISPR